MTFFASFDTHLPVASPSRPFSYIRRINRKRRKSDGVTKITLPANYWSKKGIGKVRSAKAVARRAGAK